MAAKTEQKKETNSKFDDIFITDQLHTENIKLANGETKPFFFKELPNSIWRRYAIVESSGQLEEQAENVARLISESLVEANGDKALTFEQAINIKTPIAMQMYAVIIAINKGTLKVDKEGKS